MNKYSGNLNLKNIKKAILLLYITMFFCSCLWTDVVISEHCFQIENKTDGDIEVIFMMEKNAKLSDYKEGTGRKFIVEKNDVVEVFYLSGHEGYAPNYFSTGYIIANGKEHKYTDKTGNKSILSVDSYVRISESKSVSSKTTIINRKKKDILYTINKLTIDNQFFDQ